MLWEFLADLIELRLAFCVMVLGLVLEEDGIVRKELVDGLVG